METMWEFEEPLEVGELKKLEEPRKQGIKEQGEGGEPEEQGN